MVTNTAKGTSARYPDWPIRLNKYITQAQTRQWEMGTHDCCTFAAGAVEVMTGTDLMPEFRGKYGGWKSALKALKEIGQGELYDTLVAKLGAPLRGVYAQKGDVVMYEDSCGICLGRMSMFIGEKGFVYVRLQHLQYTFRVGSNNG